MQERGELDDDLRRELAQEASRIEQVARFSAQVRFEAAKYWGTLDTFLTLTAAVAAFASGAAILQSSTLDPLAGLLAFVSGALGTAATVVRGQDKAAACTRSGRGYRVVRDQVRVFRKIDLKSMSPADARVRLAEIAREFDEVDEQAPIVGWAFWAEWRARRSIRDDWKNLDPGTAS